jgi:hypothetical protein
MHAKGNIIKTDFQTETVKKETGEKISHHEKLQN